MLRIRRKGLGLLVSVALVLGVVPTMALADVSEPPIDGLATDSQAWQELILDAQVDSSVPEGGEWLGSFTAPEDGSYRFYTTGDGDSVGALFADTDMGTLLAENDNASYDNPNFAITWSLGAGQTVYLRVAGAWGAWEGGVCVRRLDPSSLSDATLELPQDLFYETGAPVELGATVTASDGKVLVSGTDYVLAFRQMVIGEDTQYVDLDSAPSAEGFYGVSAVPAEGSNYTGQTGELWFEIQTPYDLSLGLLVLVRDAYAYTGDPVVPKAALTNVVGEEVNPSEYELVYTVPDGSGGYREQVEAPVEPGSYLVRAHAKDNGIYRGDSPSRTFTIVASNDFSYADLKVDSSSYVYTGEPVELACELLFGGSTLVCGTDYELAYYDADQRPIDWVPISAGSYYVNARALDGSGYTGRTELVAFEISRVSLEGAAVTVAAADRVYTGAAFEPEPTVTLGGKTLIAGTDYAVSYSGNIDAGTATVTVTGCGDYEGTASGSFTIAKAASSITLAAQTKTYTGKALAYTGKVTKSGSAGKVTYNYYSDAKCTKAVAATNVKNAGTYYVRGTVSADANHAAATSAAAAFTIAKAASSITLAAQTKTYTGKALAYTGKVTKSGSAGKVTYKYYSDPKCTKAVDPDNVKDAGTYYVRACLSGDKNCNGAVSKVLRLVVKKTGNTMSVKVTYQAVQASTLKNKAVTVAFPAKVKAARGRLTFAKVSGSSALSINKKTGNVTVKKGTKKGTYVITIKLSGAGNKNYESKTVTIISKIIVK